MHICPIEFKVVGPKDSFIEIIEFDTIELRVQDILIWSFLLIQETK